MIHMEHLRIKLPAGFETRASDIVRRIPDYLKNYQVTAGCNQNRLTLPRLVVAPSSTNSEIAAQIAERLIGSLDRVAGTSRASDRKHAND